jgi:lipopolysaccharide export system protein LptA
MWKKLGVAILIVGIGWGAPSSTPPNKVKEIELLGDKFNYYPEKRLSILEGNAQAHRGSDYIYANQLKIYLDQNRKAEKFVAIGNVRFKITLDPKDVYQGTTTKLTYWIKKGDILLEGPSKVVNIVTQEVLSGNYIKLNKFTKQAEVKSNGKKPIRIILKVE